MVTHNLKIELEPREDKEERIYYLGRLQFPGKLYLNKGATFLVFLAEEGMEEIQIAVNDKEHTTFSKYSKRADRMKIALDSRQDQFKNVFFVAKVQLNGYIDCGSEVVFLAFISKTGHEELQIVGDIQMDNKKDEYYSCVPFNFPDKIQSVVYTKPNEIEHVVEHHEDNGLVYFTKQAPTVEQIVK